MAMKYENEVDLVLFLPLYNAREEAGACLFIHDGEITRISMFEDALIQVVPSPVLKACMVFQPFFVAR